MGNTVYKLKAFSLCNDEIIYHIWSQQAYELLPLLIVFHCFEILGVFYLFDESLFVSNIA